jgi:hypothetical protein
MGGLSPVHPALNLTEKINMTEETTVVHVTHGPYAGQRLTMSKSEASIAFSEGWAIDPFKPVDPDKEPKQLSEEERAHVLEKAEHAVAKLRGEEHEKSMKPQHEGGYETRDVKPPASAPAPAPAKPK